GGGAVPGAALTPSLRCSVAEELLEGVPRRILAGVLSAAFELPAREVEPLAEIGRRLLEDLLGAPFLALVRVTGGGVMDAVEADLEIGPATVAGLEPAGVAVQVIDRAAFVAVAGH